MNDQSFIIKCYILKSNHDNFKEKKSMKILIKKKIDEGGYGIVFLLENDMVMKIFKKSLYKDTIIEESNCLIPIKNENRELTFYYKYINENKQEQNYIINLYCIGFIKNRIIIDSNILEPYSYFIILPYCIPFYERYKIKNDPLISKNNGLEFTIKIMKRLIEIIYFFENKYNLINIDLKLNNFMFNKRINDIIMLDFSVVKTKTKIKTKYDTINKYYIWPSVNNTLIENIPSYSVCINGLELLFGRDQIIRLPNNEIINVYLKIIEKKDKSIYNIFYNGLITKINTDNFFKLINSLR